MNHKLVHVREFAVVANFEAPFKIYIRKPQKKNTTTSTNKPQTLQRKSRRNITTVPHLICLKYRTSNSDLIICTRAVEIVNA
jgi:hypothetical protein